MLVQKAKYIMLGMRAFCTTLQVWNRYRSIPSSRRAGGSSLDTLFDEFDKDGDGHLTAAEIASALNSRGVLITEQEAAMFIKGACRPASSLCASFASRPRRCVQANCCIQPFAFVSMHWGPARSLCISPAREHSCMNRRQGFQSLSPSGSPKLQKQPDWPWLQVFRCTS